RILKTPGPKPEPKPVPTPVQEPEREVQKPRSRLKPIFKTPPSKSEKRPPKSSGKRVVVVDIGASSVKVLEVQRKADSVRIISADSRPIPPALRKNEAGLKVLLVKALRDMLPGGRLKDASLHIVQPESGVQFKRVNLPPVPEKERLNAIKFQLKKELPFPLDVCEISYRGWNSKLKQKQEIEVLAADRRALNYRLEIIDELNIMPRHISSASAAARFLVQHFRGVDANKGAVAVVDIGAAKTNITIIENGRLILGRTIATGSDDFTSVIQSLDLGPGGAELNEIQAEKYKFQIGLPAEGVDPETNRIAINMRPVVERISTEISRSLEFYHRERSGGELQKVILVGGGARMKRLSEFLSENLGVEVIVGLPSDVADLPVSGGNGKDDLIFSPALMPALALALDDGLELNLTPPHILGALRMIKVRQAVPPALLLVTVLLVAFYALALSRLNQTEHKSESIKGQLVNLNKQRAAYMVAKAHFDQLNADFNARQTDFDALRTGNPEIPLYFRTLSHLVPSSIYLERVQTLFIPEIEEIKKKKEPAKPAAKKKTDEPEEPVEKISVEKILAKLQPGDGEEEEEWIIEQRKRPVFGRVLDVRGNVYSQGSLTDVQLVDFVFALENSGYFRAVSVDSTASQADGRRYFRIICGI
ncbi:MAG: pilus assembly protein PilM, partial [Calditrichota bacterium]